MIDFQKANNLVPDGIAGPKTFGKLYGSGNANNGNPASSNSGSGRNGNIQDFTAGIGALIFITLKNG